jgi:hypothetical protein
MRPVLFSLRTSFLAVSLGATGLVFAGACGDEEEPANNGTYNPNPDNPNDPNNPGGGNQDPGTGNNTHQDAGTGGQTQCVPFGSGFSGVVCTTANGEQGFQVCTNDVPSGECRTPRDILGGFLGDGGLNFGDAGFNFGDGGIPTAACPSSMACDSQGILPQLASLAPGAAGTGICTESGKPPTCTTTADCTAAGMTSAICLDVASLDQLLAFGAQLLGIPPQFCLQACKP